MQSGLSSMNVIRTVPGSSGYYNILMQSNDLIIAIVFYFPPVYAVIIRARLDGVGRPKNIFYNILPLASQGYCVISRPARAWSIA
jgi:hypothetical protein